MGTLTLFITYNPFFAVKESLGIKNMSTWSLLLQIKLLFSNDFFIVILNDNLSYC